MVERSKKSRQWQRTRRSVLAIGAILADAAISGVGRARAYEHDHDFEDRHHGFPDHDHGFGDHDRGRHGGLACYLRGTHILTPNGERKIEDLRKGDLLITTVSSEAKPIEWIGSRCYQCMPGRSWGAALRPVHVVRGALAPGVPHRDLFLSQEHHLLLDGGLIRAVDLINGSSICLDPLNGFHEIEYLHVRLATQDLIYAEGAAAETLLRPCVPVYSAAFSGRRGQLLSHMRSAISPWLDRRNQFDKVRDRVWDRADLAQVCR